MEYNKEIKSISMTQEEYKKLLLQAVHEGIMFDPNKQIYFAILPIDRKLYFSTFLDKANPKFYEDWTLVTIKEEETNYET